MSSAGGAGPSVLLVVNSLGYGGTERMIERMTLQLSASGRVRYTVCSLGSEGPVGARLRARGVEVIALGGRGGALRQVLGGARRLRRLLRSGRFDMVHSFLYRSHFASRLARLGRVPRVPLISSERCLGDNRGRIAQCINRLMSRMSDRILAVSQAVAERAAVRDGVPRDRLAVVPNGIEDAQSDPRARARLRRLFSVGPEETVLLYLGRLHHEKGPDLLLDALARMKEASVRGWRAVFLGDGPERPALERRSAELGLSGQVAFMGIRRRVGPWIDAADILALPSREEGMPVAALEAMMRSRPVVATRVGGTPEVVRDTETGILVPPDDVVALAGALERLVRDPHERARLGACGRRVVQEEFTLERMLDRTLRQYEMLLSAPQAAAEARRSTAVARTEK